MRKIHKLWIAGAETVIGQAIIKSLDQRIVNTISTDIEDVDIRVIYEALAFSYLNQPDAIINCYELDDLKKCEENPIEAYRINALAARNLAICSRKIGARFVQISTDNVFGIENDLPYTEFDVPNPTSIYGKSKLEGENFVKNHGQKYFIVRTGYVYDSDHIDVNYDISRKISPTSATELAKFIIMLMNTPEYGTYHAHSTGICTYSEFIDEMKKQLKVEIMSKNDIKIDTIKNIELDEYMLKISSIYEFPTWEKDILNNIKHK